MSRRISLNTLHFSVKFHYHTLNLNISRESLGPSDEKNMRRKGTPPQSRIFPWLTLTALFLIGSGCSVMNFSANYYSPPPLYQQEIHGLWTKLTSELPLKNKYTYRIVTEQQAKGLKGIPAISGNTMILPENFVKYIYQNYYDDRMKVLTCVIVHELCHREFGGLSAPPEEHFKVDVQAIELLGGDRLATANYYYKSLCVMKNYWYARKGVAGHAFNTGWNLANAASAALGGPAAFVDWFATDLDRRLNMLKKKYKIIVTGAFERSASP